MNRDNVIRASISWPDVESCGHGADPL